MNILSKIKYAKMLYSENIKEINAENVKMINAFYLIALLSTFLIAIISLFVRTISNLTVIYICYFSIFVVLYILHLFHPSRWKNYEQVESKILEITILIFTLIQSTVFRTESAGVMFLVFLVALPFTFIQKPPYSFVQTGVFYVAYIVASIITKEANNYIIDILSATLTLIVSFCLTATISMHRIASLNNGRLLSHQIDIDELTKLSNRRKLNKYVNTNRSYFEDAETDVSIIMLDIDFFKLYNDTYGHLQGDVCLEAIAGVLKGINSKYDCDFVRYGGEEFVCIFINKNCRYATNVCKEVIQNIYKLKIENKMSKFNWVSISAGIASKKQNNVKTFGKLIDCADKALYVAKANGKNCYAIYKENKSNEIESL